MHCRRCGNDVTVGARFCSRCGESVDAEVVPVVAESLDAGPIGGEALGSFPSYVHYEGYDPLGVEPEDPPPPGFYYWPPKAPASEPLDIAPYVRMEPAARSMTAAPYAPYPPSVPSYAPNMPYTAYPGNAVYAGTVPYWPPRFIESRYPPHVLVTATPLRRLAGYVLDWLLLICTLGIGWLVWFCTTAPNGQTPAKQILDMYVMREDGTRAGGRYTWSRQMLVKGGIHLVNVLTLGLLWLISAMWCLWDKDRQCLWDKLGTTYVAYSPQKFKPMTAREISQSRATTPYPDPRRF